ncbi:hypothetical protein JCM33374_g4179 [Metschnikowia sp. JCM 33374]|nr:hypothetical protein JCM33374_g4179 [Metschnikowia sp. JCM 33374]
MQFSTVAILAAVASAASTVTQTDKHSTLVTITSCGSTVTNCPAHSSSLAAASSNWTASANVSTYHGAANKQYAAGAVALAAGALLAFTTDHVFILGMPSESTKAFNYAVFAAVNQIPFGKVTSYGHIAYLIGRPQNPRQVGSALKNYQVINAMLRQEGECFDDLPWWRVISSSGHIAKRDVGEHEQKRRLLEENVEVHGMAVNMGVYGWYPDEIE